MNLEGIIFDAFTQVHFGDYILPTSAYPPTATELEGDLEVGELNPPNGSEWGFYPSRAACSLKDFPIQSTTNYGVNVAKSVHGTAKILDCLMI